jgi:hypothetical protein
MFRQAGMSKQPMGILASSPELMTTAQKAMMKGQPVKAQSGTFIKNPDNMNSPMINYFRQNSPLQAIGGFVSDTMNKAYQNDSIIKDYVNKGASSAGNYIGDFLSNFAYGSGQPEKTYETKLVPEGSPSPGFTETTKKTKAKEKSEIEKITDDLNKAKQRIKKTGDIKINQDDSELLKDSKKLGNFLFSPEGAVSKSFNSIYQTVDDNVFNYFRSKPEILSNLQEEMNEKAKTDPQRNRMISGGNLIQDIGDKLAGPSSTLVPTKDGSPRGLVDPNVLSESDPRFPESFPKSKPPELPGVVALKNLSDLSKNKNGPTTKDSDDVLGISDLSFKDRVKARRDIISAALGRDVSEKDVRTDLNYNLIMTGLLVAAGESPNAMTNIAKGLAAGLAGYGKAKGEATEAKRKEDIAVGLAAVEQVFKESEAEKSRDKKPEAIRTAEYLRDNPELMTIMKGISSKNKSDEQIKLEIATALAKSSIDPSAVNVDMIDTLFKAVKGQIQTPQTPTIIPSFRIPQTVVGTDTYKPGNTISYKGSNYVVSDDGLTLNLDTTQKSS